MKTVHIENIPLKILNSRITVEETLTVYIGFYATPAIAKEVGFTHAGRVSFCRHLVYDEFKALMEVGFKPFAWASFDGMFWEKWDGNRLATKLLFSASNFLFYGGIGDYNHIVDDVE